MHLQHRRHFYPLIQHPVSYGIQFPFAVHAGNGRDDFTDCK